MDASTEVESDDGRRIASCWRDNTCYSCLRNQQHCGWCASSGTCVPLPHGYASFPSLFHPLRPVNAHLPAAICPTYDDRWELRTAALGCAVSTATLLAIIITILATMLGFTILLGLHRALRSCLKPWSGRGGWVVYDTGQAGSWSHQKSWWRTGVVWFKRRRRRSSEARDLRERMHFLRDE